MNFSRDAKNQSTTTTKSLNIEHFQRNREWSQLERYLICKLKLGMIDSNETQQQLFEKNIKPKHIQFRAECCLSHFEIKFLTI